MTLRAQQAGFTLLEVVVAFVLLALTLVTVFQIFSTGLARAGELDEHSRALVVAQSRLATVGVEQRLDGPYEARGESEDRKFRWTLTVQPYEEPPQDGGPQPMSSLQMYRADAAVAWDGSDGRTRSLKLSTLALGAKQ
jgi:general secretion pathway protein I